MFRRVPANELEEQSARTRVGGEFLEERRPEARAVGERTAFALGPMIDVNMRQMREHRFQVRGGIAAFVEVNLKETAEMGMLRFAREARGRRGGVGEVSAMKLRGQLEIGGPGAFRETPRERDRAAPIFFRSGCRRNFDRPDPNEARPEALRGFQDRAEGVLRGFAHAEIGAVARYLKAGVAGARADRVERRRRESGRRVGVAAPLDRIQSGALRQREDVRHGKLAEGDAAEAGGKRRGFHGAQGFGRAAGRRARRAVPAVENLVFGTALQRNFVEHPGRWHEARVVEPTVIKSTKLAGMKSGVARKWALAHVRDTSPGITEPALNADLDNQQIRIERRVVKHFFNQTRDAERFPLISGIRDIARRAVRLVEEPYVNKRGKPAGRDRAFYLYAPVDLAGRPWIAKLIVHRSAEVRQQPNEARTLHAYDLKGLEMKEARNASKGVQGQAPAPTSLNRAQFTVAQLREAVKQLWPKDFADQPGRIFFQNSQEIDHAARGSSPPVYTPAENKAAFDSAAAHHGLTRDVREAGYILPDGRMLDFSGRNQNLTDYERRGDFFVVKPGARDWAKGVRQVDHREIEFEGKPKRGPDESNSVGMVDFMRRGAVRVDANAGLISVDGRVRLSAAQEARLREIVELNQGKVYVDAEDGRTRMYQEYDVSNAKKVIGDLRRWSRGEEPKSGMRFQEKGGAKRGAVEFHDGRTIIRLFEAADHSTFLHESSHVFLQEFQKLVDEGLASEGARRDWQTLRDWLGAKEGAELTRAQHEKFARGFEAYLMEGKAPSLKLVDAFRRFRDWLVGIYRTARGLTADA